MGARRSTDRHQARSAMFLAHPLADGARNNEISVQLLRWLERAGSKPSRGYSNPEGGRCRGTEPPGEPDLSRWNVP